MQERTLIASGAINMLLAVAAGAFGAHALKSVLSPEMLAIWQTAVSYHMVHGLGLLLIALLMPRIAGPWMPRAGSLMLAGIVIFCGSLYILALSGLRILGAVTPLGGLAFLLAWAMLAYATLRPAQK
jgi:uncharacterized membrane protein YgdD (TMEM256/DUF423 family)